jgi:O-antigen/teichoic acid export membrane protein
MNATLTKKSVIANILALFSGTTVAQFATALTLFLTARALGAESFGQYAACFALAKVTSVIFNLGMDTWLLREGRRGIDPLGRLVGSNLVSKFFLGLLWLAVIFILGRFLNQQTYPPGLLWLMAIAVWLEAVLNTAVFSFNAALRNHVSAVLTILSSLALLAVTFYFLIEHRDSNYTYANARLVIDLIFALICILWMARTLKLSTALTTIRRILREIAPYAVSDAFVVIYTQADVTILAMLLGPQATGIYAPASSIVRSLFVIPQAVHLVMVPVLSQMLAEKSQRLQKAFRQMSLVLAGVGAALWLGTALLGPYLVWFVLGKDFSASAPVLTILSAILFLKACSYAMAAMIVAAGYQGYRVIVQGIAAGLNVALNLLFALRFGVDGVAWIYVISEAVLLAGYMVLVGLWQTRSQRVSLAPH